MKIIIVCFLKRYCLVDSLLQVMMHVVSLCFFACNFLLWPLVPMAYAIFNLCKDLERLSWFPCASLSHGAFDLASAACCQAVLLLPPCLVEGQSIVWIPFRDTVLFFTFLFAMLHAILRLTSTTVVQARIWDARLNLPSVVKKSWSWTLSASYTARQVDECLWPIFKGIHAEMIGDGRRWAGGMSCLLKPCNFIFDDDAPRQAQ